MSNFWKPLGRCKGWRVARCPAVLEESMDILMNCVFFGIVNSHVIIVVQKLVKHWSVFVLFHIACRYS